MYKHAQEREERKLKFEAAIHGVELKGEIREEVKKSTQSAVMEEKKDLFLFRDPKEYDGMSVEKRNALTKKMMNAHKKWASGILKK